MASYKSHYGPPRSIEDDAPTTRLPKRSITPATISSQLPTSSSQSKLQKRRPSRDEPARSERGLSNQRELPRRVSSRQTPSTAAPSTIQAPGFASYKARSASSSTRLPKLEVPANTRTPSLVSGSSASTIESPRSNVLRRKQPSVGSTGNRHVIRARDDSMSSIEGAQQAERNPGEFKDPFTESVFGISLPPTSNVLARADPELESPQSGLYDSIGPLDIYPIPTPQYAVSATPSTRYADSPGAFSVSSAATSATSYSPATALSKSSYRVRQVSPLESRPPISRHRAPEESTVRTTHGLSTVRESSTSSSSASTVMTDAGKVEMTKKQLPTVPQSPPVFKAAPILQSKPRTQPVPELAHLADPSPVSPTNSRRPSRPSRDGTPEIFGLRDPSPIIQSNMAGFPNHHRRTSSTDSRFGSLAIAKTRMAVPVKTSSRNPSPVPTSSIPSTSSALKHGISFDSQKDRDTRRSSTLPAPAPAPSPGKRFGFFSRRTKTDPAPHASKSDSKLARKGPAAGTGHEGYGRHAVRGRSSSSIGASIGRSASAGTTAESLAQTPSTRKSSMTSTTSGEMDDFFLNRLTPVILRGAGSGSELTSSPEPMNSSSSLDISSRAKLPMGNSSSISAEPVNGKARPRLLPSAMPNTTRSVSPTKKPSRRPSESDDDTKRSFLPTLASRRTSRAAKPVEGMLSPPRSRSISKSRKDSASDEGSWLRSSKKTKPEKEKERSRPSKWNFFSRAHAAPRVETPASQEIDTASPGPGSRSVAHYALMDAQPSLNMEDIEQLMREAAGNTDTESVLSDRDSMRKERMQSILLPPKPILPAFAPPSRPASPKVVLRSDQSDQSPQRYANLLVNTDVQPVSEPSPRHSQAGTIFDLSPPSSPVVQQPYTRDNTAAGTAPVSVPAEPFQREEPPVQNPPPPNVTPISPPRPSRLPQVGRIPQVVSSRGKPRGLSSRSFSRPFVTDQSRPTALPRTSFDSIGSLVATAGPPEPFPILQGLGALSHGSAIATISPSFDESRQSEFFKFPPRKDSEVSYSSSSGVWSFAPVAGTAVIPPPEAPLSDDELWNEYDDLLDQVVSPGGTVRKAPKHKEYFPVDQLPLRNKTSSGSILSECSEKEVSVPSVHIRRSRLLAALYAHQSPTSSMALSDVINDYGDRKLSVVDSTTGRLSLPLSPSLSSISAQRCSTRTSLPVSMPSSDRQSKATITSRSDKDRNSANTNRYRDTRLMDIAEAQVFGHESMADLRFGALMTSKWLSFGRVLFSPVHNQLKDVNEDRILVIDGTGKDWSYYCALTYSDAAVYDLGPAPSSPPSNDRRSALPNHRHIRHSSLTNALPYPQNFFACVVLRFPSAQRPTTQNFLLAEAKRVLRPGGYLEFSVLDLDLVNMGNRARRAVRQLKMDIHHVDESISLRNISDEIIGCISRKRFVECKSCVVGVPVAGSLPTPNDVNHPMRKNSTASSRRRADSNLHPAMLPKSEPSFSDLLNTPTPSESTDKEIAGKVARVGRWWYSRCYESIVLPDGDGPDAALATDILKNSIWRDNNLIRECEELGTSFRMLIGYAQKPEVSLRRHVSV